MSEKMTVLEIADALFEFMKVNDIEISMAMGGFAAALCLMGSQLRVPKEDLVKSFALTVDTIYKNYGDEDEAMH